MHAYQAWVEWERTARGQNASTDVVLLTNRECPFKCVMCDLWTHTLDDTVPRGAIVQQIREALAEFPDPQQIKLYNAGSFFDPRQIPEEDDAEIAGLLRGIERVIVESHPAFLSGAYGERCLRFQSVLTGQLEVAIGLETAHPDVLARLNKRMTLDDFRRAADFLSRHHIALRVFILLNPPFMPVAENVEWACRSIDEAIACGATACSIIPTRSGNGALEALGDAFAPPRLSELEAVVEYGISRGGPRVFADLWDIEQFVVCPCTASRVGRLKRMNAEQRIPEPVVCDRDRRH